MSVHNDEERLTSIVGESLDGLVRAGPLSLGDVLNNTEHAVVQLGAEGGAQSEGSDLAGEVLGPVAGLQLKDRCSSTAWSLAIAMGTPEKPLLTGTAARVSDTSLSGSLLRPQFPARVGDRRTVLRALVALTKGRKVPDNIAVKDVATKREVEDVGGEGEGLARTLGRVRGGERRDGVVNGRVEVGGNLVQAGYGQRQSPCRNSMRQHEPRTDRTDTRRQPPITTMWGGKFSSSLVFPSLLPASGMCALRIVTHQHEKPPPAWQSASSQGR